MERRGAVSRDSDSRRKYDSTRRQADAEARHQRIVEEAIALFLEVGFGATSIGQIANAAGVSAQTIYATFGSKAGVLSRAYDYLLTGDFEAVPVRQRMPGFDGVHPTQYCAVFSEHAALVRGINDRVAALLRVVEQSASVDPALGELRADLVSRLRSDCRAWVNQLDPDALASGVTRAEAADVMGLIVSPTTYSILTVDLGWPVDRYQRWLATTLPTLLLKPELLSK
jgi:AcrR family transcriptional regulator